jgi:hypothetical protein
MRRDFEQETDPLTLRKFCVISPVTKNPANLVDDKCDRFILSYKKIV